MSVTSLSYYLFLLVSVVFYYVFPPKHRWLVLLLSSIYFVYTNSGLYLLFIIVYSVLVSYFGTNILVQSKKRKPIFIATIILLIIPLFIYKYINLVPLFINSCITNKKLTVINIIAPIGISYYTLSIIGYVIDIYWETYCPQKNILKHFLFCLYFPSLVSGPILRFLDVKDHLFNQVNFKWEYIYKGFYRITYGLMKKIVIADNLAIKIVNPLFENISSFPKSNLLFSVLAYAIQIYCDFSGCMDIVCGSSLIYGIELKENFISPFLSKNLSEFWRRWHISLGNWGRDYIMYPILKSQTFQLLNKKCKKVFGKKIGKKIPTILSMFILWLLIGIWHGASVKYIVAAGLIPFLYASTSLLFEDLIPKFNSNNIIIKMFQIVRTISLMCLLWLFVCVDNIEGLKLYLNTLINNYVPTSFYSINTKYLLGIILSLIIVAFVDYYKYKEIDVLSWFFNKNIMFRWLTVFVIIGLILLFGNYGVEYVFNDFIYGRF